MENKNIGGRLSSYGLHPAKDISHILAEAEKIEQIRARQMSGEIGLRVASVEIERLIDRIWDTLDAV